MSNNMNNFSFHLAIMRETTKQIKERTKQSRNRSFFMKEKTNMMREKTKQLRLKLDFEKFKILNSCSCEDEEQCEEQCEEEEEEEQCEEEQDEEEQDEEEQCEEEQDEEEQYEEQCDGELDEERCEEELDEDVSDDVPDYSNQSCQCQNNDTTVNPVSIDESQLKVKELMKRFENLVKLRETLNENFYKNMEEIIDERNKNK